MGTTFEMPTTPAQRAGWQVLGVYHSVNGQYLVVARRGAQVLRIERLTADRVRTFDAESYWSDMSLR